MSENESKHESSQATRTSIPQVIGTNLTLLIGVVLILAGVLKLFQLGDEDMIEGLKKAHLIQHLTLISIAAIASGILLLIPFTRTLGFLMATAYWGGAIVAHLTYNDSVVMPATFLGIMWVSEFYRHWVKRGA